MTENNTESRHLDASTIAAISEEIGAAKARGWLQNDLKRWFASKAVAHADYKSALSGAAVPASVAGTLIQISITGLPERPCAPNAEDIRKHIEWLIEPAKSDYADALFEIAYDAGQGHCNAAALFDLDEVEKAVEFAVQKNLAGSNVYIAAALKLPDTERKGRSEAKDFYVATAVPIDIDSDYDTTRARMATVCEDALVVTTGLTPERRSQHWTRLVEPCDDEADFAHAFAALVLHTNADAKVKDSARIMRLGGTVSYPGERKQAKGYCTELTVTTIRDNAKPSDIERLKSLEEAPLSMRQEVTREAGQSGEIQKDWVGRVTDGRESHFRDILLRHIRQFQEENGADPEPQELFDSAFSEFSDPLKVKNDDGRWTNAAGQQQLQMRVQNTMRRLRSGRLAKLGLYSYETGEGQAQAEEVQANRNAVMEARKNPETFVAEVVSSEGEITPVVTETESVTATGASIFDPWERYAVPAFPLEVLPPVLRDYVEYLSVSTGGDRSAVAMSALAALSGCMSQEFALKMKRSGDWYVKPRLWVMLVGDPSSKKSPIMSACVRPVRSWESVGVKDYQSSYARWKADGDKNEPEPVKPTRFLLNEVTSEKLGEILSRQDRGVLVEQDEVSGWIGAMDKYGGGKGAAADRGFWLGAYNGGPRTIDRLGRGETFVQNLCVAFIGGVQPDRLAEMANLTSDGLLQRFLPVMMTRAVYSGEVESEAPAEAYKDLCFRLLRMMPAKLQMDEGAREASGAFQRFLHDLEGMDGLGKGFCGFAGKLSGIHGSLSLVLHMISDPDAVLDAVSERTVRDAERIIRDFCIPHGLELYRSSTDGGDWEALRKIASFILTSDKERFTASDFTAGVRSLRGLTTWEIGQRVSPLVAGGWLSEDEGGKGWAVVKNLRLAMSERRAEEARRKAEVMKIIKKGRVGADGE